jgi:hypothetical protein
MSTQSVLPVPTTKYKPSSAGASAGGVTIFSELDTQPFTVFTSVVCLACAIAFLIVVYIRSPALATHAKTILIVMLASMLLNVPFSWLGSKETGGIGKNTTTTFALKSIFSSTLYLALVSAAYVVYYRYADKIYGDAQTVSGSSAQSGFAWCLLILAAILVLRSSAKSSAGQNIVYLMAPFLSIATVCLGLLLIQVKYLTTDG